MRPILPLAGKRFGRLVVLQDYPIGPRGKRTCLCDCGKTVVVAGGSLKSGITQSCGCLQKERTSKQSIRHGMRNTAEYGIWANMLNRTRNVRGSSDPRSAARYLLRGVCARWDTRRGGSFENFYVDMGPRPSPRHSIERKDNDGPYSPENCVWALPKTQARNRSNNRWVTYNGERMVMAAACELSGVSPQAVLRRIKYGWEESEWFIPVRARRAAV
jgi:hypothetical protein